MDMRLIKPVSNVAVAVSSGAQTAPGRGGAARAPNVTLIHNL